MEKKLVLIDGHAILHRAFHSMPPNFSAPDGRPTNAVYGFMNMLLQVLDGQKPDYLAVAFDLPQPTFRMQQYTQYQAKRPEMQGNLAEQIPIVHELLETLKIEHFEMGGFEADDVIGTLAVSGQQLVDSVVIVTGDRDMLQLVNEKVKVCVPVKGLSQTKTYDEKLIMEEFGVRPEALKGDASDNYPGVRGIGPKTAQDLIAKYGTLEELYKNLEKLVPKVAKKLAEGAEDAGMGKKLAQIVTDVPVHLDLEKASMSKIDWLVGAQFMRVNLGFHSIPERIEKRYLKLKIQERKVEKPKVKNDSEQLGLI